MRYVCFLFAVTGIPQHPLTYSVFIVICGRIMIKSNTSFCSTPHSDLFQSYSMGDRESSAKPHRTDRSLPVAMQSDQRHLIRENHECVVSDF